MRDNGFQVQLFLAALGLFDHHGVFGCVVSIQRSGGAGGQSDKIRSMVDLRYLILRLLGAEHLDTTRHVGLQNIAPGIQLGVLSFGFYLAALTQAFLPQRQRARKGKIDMRVKALGVIHRQTAAL